MAIDEAIHSQASTVEAHAAPVAPPAAPAQLTEDQVDPLRSRAVQQELPGLTPAFDEQYMRSALQGVLFDAQRPRATIERCEVDQATYVPGEFVILRYTLALQDTSGGPAREALVSGRLFPSQAACEAYVAERLLPLVPEVAGREETAPFDRPVGMVADLHMAVHAWPIDGDLPALIGATDPRRLVPILGETLPALQGLPFAVDGCRVELVDYGRQHRATLRYHVRGRAGGAAEPRDLLVYGKVTGDGTGAMAETISSTLRERVGASATGYRFSVPLALPWQPTLKLSLLEALPGEALIADQLKARLRGKPAPVDGMTLEQMIDACAHIAATLHTSGLALGRRRTLDDELDSLRRAVAGVLRVSPDLGGQLDSAVDTIARAGEDSAPLPLCCNHGDFTYGQILFDGARCGLIDFDSVSQAEPALDLGQFLTYVRVASLKSKLTPAETAALIDQLAERFLDTYADAAGDLIADRVQLRRRVRIYRAISLVRRSLRSWQKFKPGRIMSALEVLEEELAALSPL